MSDKTAKHPVTVAVSEHQIACLLCSAREGSFSTWAQFESCPYTSDSKTLLPFLFPTTVLDLEENGRKHILDMIAIRKGLDLLQEYPRLLFDILSDNADEVTADEFLQLCLFGELLYG